MHTQKHTLIPLHIVIMILFPALNFSISVQGMQRRLTDENLPLTLSTVTLSECGALWIRKLPQDLFCKIVQSIDDKKTLGIFASTCKDYWHLFTKPSNNDAIVDFISTLKTIQVLKFYGQAQGLGRLRRKNIGKTMVQICKNIPFDCACFGILSHDSCADLNYNFHVVNHMSTTLLTLAIYHANIPAVRSLLEHKASANYWYVPDGIAYIHNPIETAILSPIGSAEQKIECIKLLAHHGTDMHWKNGINATYIHKAIFGDHCAVLEHLITHYGIDINAQTSWGESALMMLLHMNNEQPNPEAMITILMHHDTNPYIKNRGIYSSNAFYYAERMATPRIQKLLAKLDKGESYYAALDTKLRVKNAT